MGSKNPSHVTGGDKSQLTVMACTCAAGYFIPPMIIFDRKKFIDSWVNGGIPGTLHVCRGFHRMVGLIANNFMAAWFQHFLEYVPQKASITVTT